MQQPALKRALASIGSLRLTAAGIALLIACVLASYLLDRPGSALSWSGWWLAVPLILLALNLAAAIFVDPRINRRPGLLVFHIALFSIFALGAYGELAGFHGRIEMVSGQAFDSTSVVELEAGPLHGRGNLDSVHFLQGDIRVAYAPDIIRQDTRSTIVRSSSGEPETFGDNVPLSFHDYDFYTTSNKGIAAIVVWTASDSPATLGAIHFPSYPLREWQQRTEWRPSPSISVTVALEGLTPLDPDEAFILDESLLRTVKLALAGRSLSPGESITLPGGRLTLRDLRLWMGYEIRSTPLTNWIFVCALVGIIGIGWHFFAPERAGRRLVARASADQTDGLRVRGA